MVTLPHYMDERPIISIRCGHANMTSITMGDAYWSSLLRHTGIDYAIKWIDQAALHDKPRALEDDARFQGMHSFTFESFRQSEWWYWEEYPATVAKARELIPSPRASFPSKDALEEAQKAREEAREKDWEDWDQAQAEAQEEYPQEGDLGL